MLTAWLGRSARALRERVRTRGRKALLRALRLTTAATAAYLVAKGLLPGTEPLLAPLTALLVVQLTLYSTVRNGWQRVLSVVAGVGVAVGFSAVVGLAWWSLAGLVAASIVVGQLLRLGPHLLEVPISAMLVLAVGGAGSAATDRIVETLVGAGVGLLANLVLPPAVEVRNASNAVGRYADDIAGLLATAAEGLAGAAAVEDADRWLEEARRLNRHVARVDRALVTAEESRRLNPRALGRPDTGPTLRSGLETLEHVTVAVRSMFRAVRDGMESTLQHEEGYAYDVRQAFAELLRDVVGAMAAFGRLVEAESGAEEAPTEAALAAALDGLREARARLTEMLLVDPREDAGLWELNSSVLHTVERVLRELDVEERARLRERVRADLARHRTAQAATRLRTQTRQLADRPLRRRS